MFKALVVIALALAACDARVMRRMKHQYPHMIVGGSEVNIADYPYQLGFEYGGSLICGASIHSENYAVCAAHCVVGMSVSNVALRAGSTTRESGGTLHKASSIVYNANYDEATTDYDVSVIKVSTPFSFGTNVQPIPLATSEPTSGNGNVSGWGTTTSGGTTLPSKLRAVSVPIVSRSACNSDYDGEITARMICAGVSGKDSCQGDSGGPLEQNGELIGIVSWGYGCAAAGYPGVYTNVANSNIQNFITQNTK